jgi:hypothetical protein
LTFAGGEELYVFINKQLVVQLFHDPGNNSVPCAIVELQSASGSFSIILSTFLKLYMTRMNSARRNYDRLGMELVISVIPKGGLLVPRSRVYVEIVWLC